MVCCLFGHKETPASIAAELGKVIEHLIQESGVDVNCPSLCGQHKKGIPLQDN